jgi:hypothetical protein
MWCGALCPGLPWVTVRCWLISLSAGGPQDLLGEESVGGGGWSSLERTSSSGIVRALLDMLLLSRCSLVIHPFASSFAEEAAHFHLRPSVQVNNTCRGHHSLGRRSIARRRRMFPILLRECLRGKGIMAA